MNWTDIYGIRCTLSDQYQWLYFDWYIICFNSYDLMKCNYEGQGSSSAISESSSKCYYEFMFTFLLDKTYMGLWTEASFKMTFSYFRG